MHLRSLVFGGVLLTVILNPNVAIAADDGEGGGDMQVPAQSSPMASSENAAGKDESANTAPDETAADNIDDMSGDDGDNAAVDESDDVSDDSGDISDDGDEPQNDDDAGDENP